MLERDYQARLITELRLRFPGCFILKNDTDYMQGIPDLTIFYKDKWAMLEVKASAKAPLQPNQEYFIQELNAMSFAAFIYPSNQEEVFRGLQHAFESRRTTRLPERE